MKCSSIIIMKTNFTHFSKNVKKKFLTFNKKWCSEKYFYKSKFKVGKFRKIFRNFYFFSSNLWHTTSLKLSWNLWKIDIYENRNLSILWKISKFSVKIFFQISRNWKKFFHKKIFFLKKFFQKTSIFEKTKIDDFWIFSKKSKIFIKFIEFYNFFWIFKFYFPMTKNDPKLTKFVLQKPILSWF